MQGLLKQPGYRLYAPGSPEAGALLAEQGLGPADIERALDPAGYLGAAADFTDAALAAHEGRISW